MDFKKFKTPLDAITKWKGIKDALDPINIASEDSYEYLPDVEDFGNFNDLPPEDKEILNEFIKYNVHNYEVGVTIFDSNGDADLDEIGRSIKLNLKDNPDLEKYIDWSHFFNFLIGILTMMMKVENIEGTDQTLHQKKYLIK